MADAAEYTPLDEVDRAILQLLQRDARHTTAVEIAETIGVSDSTVRNRIEALEEENVIEGYAPMVNYSNAGFMLQVRFTCTARIANRERLATDALQIQGVVEVREMMTGRENVEVTAVAPRHEDLTHVAMALDELGLDIEREELNRHRYVRPFNHFGTEDMGDDEAATHDV